MSQKFENRINLLKKEINDIKRNINLYKNKNHSTVSLFIKHFKKNYVFDQYINNCCFINNNTDKIVGFNNYKNENYNNDNRNLKTETNISHKYNNIDKIHNTKIYSANVSKFKDYFNEKSYKIINRNNFNYNYKKILNSDINKKEQQQLIYNTTRKNSIINKKYNDISKTISNKKKNSFLNENMKSNHCIINDVNYNKLEAVKKILNCNDIDNCVNTIEKYEKCFSFVENIKNIYNSNNSNKNNGPDLNNILYWINNLVKQNKYEQYCLDTMKKYNIQNFNEFQKIIYGSMQHLEKDGFFLSDIKKILFDENSNDINYMMNNKINNSSKRNKSEQKLLNENFEDIAFYH